MSVSIEPLRNSDRGARIALSRLAFGSTEPADLNRPLPPNDHVVAAYLDDELCAAATFHEDGQWICGKQVRMGGVGGVTVAPHVRGHGFAKAVMRAGLHLMHQRGEAISTLYPTTGTLYRSLGYGYSGEYAYSRIEIAELPDVGAMAGYQFVPAGFGDARALYNSVAPAHNGWLARSAMHWVISEYDHQASKAAQASYLVQRNGADVGFVAFVVRRDGGGFRFDVSASQLFGVDGDAFRAIFAFVKSMGSTAQALRTRVPEYVLNATLDHPHRVERTNAHPWMTRIIDARAAVAQRGYSPHINAEVHLDLHDPEIEHNDGPFVLRVRDGVGVLTPGGNATVAMRINDFATAFVGGPCLAGQLVGVFAAPTTPTMIDFF